MKRWGILAGVMVLACAVLASVVFLWLSHSAKAHNQQDYLRAVELLESSQAAEALQIIRAREHGTVSGGVDKGKWLDLEIRCLQDLRRVPQLLAIHDRSFDALARHEKASLLVARALLQLDQQEAFARLRESWRGRESRPVSWLVVDSDALVRNGKQEEAVTLLESQTFEGKDDAVRLVRLALLSANTNMPAAWKYLTSAFAADPGNAEVRSFRGQILERLGKKPLARVEYVAAHLADVKNPLFRDQLAEFYRRCGLYQAALDIWVGGLEPPSTDFIWLKALFWSRVTFPVDVDWGSLPVPDGDLKPLVVYLLDLPSGAFWNAETFEHVAEARRFLKERQEVYWLRLLSFLRSGQEAEALSLLNADPFRGRSWSPDIERALKAILSFRLKGSLCPGGTTAVPMASPAPPQRHQFLNQLDGLVNDACLVHDGEALPGDLAQLLGNEEAFSAAFLAGGWIEAALRLHRLDVIPEGFPNWLAYGLTQALRYGRGNEEAYAFASGQASSPALNVLTGEILLAQGNIEKALELLYCTASEDSDAGYRAAWLWSQAQIERGELDRAKAMILKQPRLRSSGTGKALLARIALAQGHRKEADRLFSELGAESPESKVNMARQAFQEKNWTEAKRLSEELVLQFPDSVPFRTNLQTVLEAEKAQ